MNIAERKKLRVSREFKLKELGGSRKLCEEWIQNRLLLLLKWIHLISSIMVAIALWTADTGLGIMSTKWNGWFLCNIVSLLLLNKMFLGHKTYDWIIATTHLSTNKSNWIIYSL